METFPYQGNIFLPWKGFPVNEMFPILCGLSYLFWLGILPLQGNLSLTWIEEIQMSGKGFRA